MRYAVFLRGINVGGIRVPMAQLRSCLADLGLSEVKTYLQSGNVTLTSSETADTLRPRIEEALSATFGYQARVLIRDHDELAGIVAGYPFPADADHHRYAIFCDSQSIADDLAAARGEEDVAAGSSVVYWRCPKGSTLKTPFSKQLERREIRPVTTNRNLNTLEKML